MCWFFWVGSISKFHVEAHCFHHHKAKWGGVRGRMKAFLLAQLATLDILSKQLVCLVLGPQLHAPSGSWGWGPQVMWIEMGEGRFCSPSLWSSPTLVPTSEAVPAERRNKHWEAEKNCHYNSHSLEKGFASLKNLCVFSWVGYVRLKNSG